MLLCWRGWKPRREKSVGVRGLRRDMWWVVLWRGLLYGREAGLRMEYRDRDRESEGKWSNQLLCRQNEGEFIWDVKDFRKVVEVNRKSASSVCGLGMRSFLVFFPSQQSKIDAMPLEVKNNEPTSTNRKEDLRKSPQLQEDGESVCQTNGRAERRVKYGPCSLIYDTIRYLFSGIG